MKRKTKIVCTIGPAVSSEAQLRALAENGMDVARLNFSHGNHAEFERVIKDIRAIEADIKRPIGILGDIQGPKIRVGSLPNGKLELSTGEEVWVLSGEAGAKQGITTTYKDFCKDVGVGNRVFVG